MRTHKDFYFILTLLSHDVAQQQFTQVEMWSLQYVLSVLVLTLTATLDVVLASLLTDTTELVTDSL